MPTSDKRPLSTLKMFEKKAIKVHRNSGRYKRGPYYTGPKTFIIVPAVGK